MRRRRQIPQPPDSDLLNAARFIDDPLRFVEGLQGRFHDIAAVPIPGRGQAVVITSPALVRDVLSRPVDFGRFNPLQPATRLSERGLVQSDGELHQQQRSIMGPAFTGRQVREYANTVGRRVEELAAEWHTFDEGEERNLHREMTTLTMQVASEILLGEDIGRERAKQFYEWMAVAGQEFEVSVGAFVPTSSSEFRQAAEGISGLAEEIIERRRERSEDQGGQSKDLLGLLLTAEDDPSVHYPPNQIRDEVVTFLIAGHETTALALTYTLSLVSWHPEVRKQVREEARTVLGEDTPQFDHVSDLEYTGLVRDEAMRLYPPTWAVFRQATRTSRLGKYRIQAGSAIVMPQWSIHRDSRYFDTPLEFDPDRWRQRDPTSVEAYFPFGAGPYACIGRRLALSGLSLGLARLTQEFEIDVAPSALDRLQPAVTIRPPEGVRATIWSLTHAR